MTAMRPPAPSEESLHASLVAWAAVALPKDAVLQHCPSEGKRGWRAQRWLKHSGHVAGFPDLMLLFRGGILFLELKSERGRLSPAQVAMHARLADAGFFVTVARTFESATGAIAEFVKSRRAAA